MGRRMKGYDNTDKGFTGFFRRLFSFNSSRGNMDYKRLVSDNSPKCTTSGGPSNIDMEAPSGPCKADESLRNYGSVVDTSEMELRLRSRDRAISKEGVCNFQPTNVDRQRRKFASDIFTTLLEVKWRWTLFTFCFTYFGSWSLFAVGWYLIVYFHGDTQNLNNPNWKPCISGIQNFTSAFLFSVETQHTTGYGFYHLTEECPEAIILFCIQSIFGVILEGLMVGLVFVKMSRAKKRSETLMFSRNAVICLRDGILCFCYRVADMRKSHLLEAHVRAQFIKKRTTAEGEVITFHQQELEVGGDGEKEDKILLFWPTTVVHKIDSSSPLYSIKPSDLHVFNTTFEIIVVLEGIVESTGLTTQARSSYLPSEMLWGHRFQNLTSMKSSTGERIVDYSLFHETSPVEMPTKYLSSDNSNSDDDTISAAGSNSNT